jgi:CSLREA domain-containing protein
MAARVLSRRLWGAGPLLGMLLAALTLAPATAGAATIRVDTTTDGLGNDGTCTLREAVLAANNDTAVLGCESGSGNDTVVLLSGTHELTTAPDGTEFDPLRGSLDVDDPEGSTLEITPFIGRSSIDGGGIDRVITARSPLVLSRVTITGGNSALSAEADGLGGGVAAPTRAPRVLRTANIPRNTATLRGGGVHATGPLLVSGSTITANSVDSSLAGSGGGGIDAHGYTSIAGSTIAANTAESDDNLARGGGIRFTAQLAVTGSILADNSAEGGSPQCHAEGGGAAPTSAGFNVVESTSGCGITLASSDVTADPALGPLTDNGGPTPTLAILPSSQAANLGPAGAGCSGSDQRGAPRGAGGSCDAGSYEINNCGATPANVVGGPGPDTLSANKPVVSVIGLGGDDRILGGGGADSICGGPGIDTLDGGGAGDYLDGGPDVDIASYASATSPVVVILDGVANDGRAGEGDFVLTESVIGGTASDSITGDGLANGVQGRDGDDKLAGADGNDSLLGQNGNDTIGGGDGDDELRGGDGNDTIAGDEGNDRLDGEGGNDRLDGGDGNDRIFGSGGKNTLIGGAGNDTLTGGPGKDLLKCGKGRDVAFAAKKDKVKRDCEKVVRTKR